MQINSAVQNRHTLIPQSHPNIIIAGDFNTGDISWDSGEVIGNSDAPNARKLLGITEHFGLTQHQCEVTRQSSNAVLDLVFSSNPNLVSRVNVVPGMSDHHAILTTLDVRPKSHVKKPHKVYRYKAADFDGLRADMANYATDFLSNNPGSKSLDDNWTSFKDMLLQSITKHIPTSTTKQSVIFPGCRALLDAKSAGKIAFIGEPENPRSRQIGPSTAWKGSIYRN